MVLQSSVKYGDKLWCIQPCLGSPRLGTVIALTVEPGKLVGMEFEEPVPSRVAHLDCDKKGRMGYCVWAHPNFLFTLADYQHS